jgi:trigger factor
VTVEIVEVNGCKRNLVVEIPPDEVAREVDRVAREYAQRVKVPGFRPGRVPLNIVKQRYAEEVRNDATHDLIERSWKEALSSNHLHPLSEPVVDDVKSSPGDPLKFTVSFEILPSVEARDYTQIPVSLVEQPVQEEDVDKALDELRERHAESVPVEGEPIRDGHIVTLEVNGTFEGGGKPMHQEDVVCIVGDSEMNETFSDNLRGARTGEERSFDVSYPADYHDKRFAGDTVHYRVSIKAVNEKRLPEPTDEFAKDIGDENLEQLRTRLRNELVTRAGSAAEKKAREQVLEELVRRNAFDVPETLIKAEVGDFIRNLAATFAQQGIDINRTSIDWKKVLEEQRPRAEEAVRRTILLDAVAEQERIEVSDQDLDAEFEKLAEPTHKSALALRAQLEKDNRIEGFRQHLRRNKALDFIYRNATISRG